MRLAIVAGGQTAEAQGTRGSAGQLELAATSRGHDVGVVELPTNPAQRLRVLEGVRDFDVAIPMVPGLEGTFELLGSAYVGSPPDAAALAANKVYFNAFVTSLGLRKVPYRSFDLSRSRAPRSLGIPGPWYVKPARLGASYGITRIEDPRELAGAIEAAAEHDTLILVETEVPRPFVEVEVAAIVGETVLLSPPTRIEAPGATWRDSGWKYSVDERPEPFDDISAAARCTEIVRLLIETSGLTGAMRFDLFVSEAGHVYVGEANALPGHGVASTFPRIFELAGIDRGAQLASMLASAQHCQRARSALRIRG